MVTQPSSTWIRKVLSIPYYAFGLISPEIDENDSTTFVEGAVPHAPKDITIFPREISNFGIVALDIAPANTDDGNEIFGMFDCPYDLDPNHNIGFRVKYTQSGAGTDGVTWTLLQGTVAADALLEVEDHADFAVLDTALVEKNSAVANEMLITDRGIRNDIGLTVAQISAGASIRVTLTATTVDAGQTGVALLSLLMDYVPYRIKSIPAAVDAGLRS